LVFLETVCDVDEQRRRLEMRQQHDTRSDGRVELMELQREDFEPENPDHAELFHLISTEGPKIDTRAHVEEVLRAEGLLPSQ
jgi:hypothetical protein